MERIGSDARGVDQRRGLDLRHAGRGRGALRANRSGVHPGAAQLVTFLKLTSGVFAGVFIAFLSFFYDPNDRGGFGGKLGLLVGVLFAVLVNLRTADSSIGEPAISRWSRDPPGHAGLIVVLALVALRDRRKVERGMEVRHPDWPMLVVVGSIYGIVIAGLVLRAAWS